MQKHHADRLRGSRESQIHYRGSPQKSSVFFDECTIILDSAIKLRFPLTCKVGALLKREGVMVSFR